MYYSPVKNIIGRMLWLGLALFAATAVQAGEVAIPNTFTSGTPALAAQVNANFAAVETAVDDNNTRIAALEAAVATLQASLATANATISTHTSQISGINNSNVMDLEPYLTVGTDSRGPLLRLSGVNLQLVNGLDSTNTINGLGNLIVGYDAARTFGSIVCSKGQYTDQATCETNSGTWAQSHKSGSHNIIGGDYNSYSSYGGLVLGMYNVSNRDYASVSGGFVNTASGIYSSISGGESNVASGNVSSVSGGAANTAGGGGSSVSGGYANTASGLYSSVSGGYTRSALGSYDWVAGTLLEGQ